MISARERQRAVELIEAAHQGGARLKPACQELGIDVCTDPRWTQDGGIKADGRPAARRPVPANQLTLRSGHRAWPCAGVCQPAAQSDRTPAGRSGGVYCLGVELLPHPAGGLGATPPRLVARAPGAVWTWDISWLPGPVKGLFFYRYLIVDLYSRQIVGWEVYECESAASAAEVVRRAVLVEQGVDRPLVLHADNGSPMKGEIWLEPLYRLGIGTSYSRPRTRNDNPYAEALFRTGKYRPDYPTQGFASLEEARVWVPPFVQGYNHEHRHSGIRFVTPAQRHQGQDSTILAQRQAVYEQARERHPERWAGPIRNWQPITEVWLNPSAEVIDIPIRGSQMR